LQVCWHYSQKRSLHFICLQHSSSKWNPTTWKPHFTVSYHMRLASFWSTFGMVPKYLLFDFVSSMYCEHFPMCLGIRVALHLGYIALIRCALCDGPTFAAFWPNSNATRWRSDLVWYVPHQYSFLEHGDM
jgi:hypothetical protein